MDNYSSHKIRYVAFRGLWDKFAKPNTTQAYKRSILKGVPTVIECHNSINIEEDFAWVWEANERSVPIFFKVFDFESLKRCTPKEISEGWVFVIESNREDPATFCPVWAHRKGVWELCGYYLPVQSINDFLKDKCDLEGESLDSQYVLFESRDTCSTSNNIRAICWEDEEVESALTHTFLKTNNIAIVSDFVEGLFAEKVTG